MFAQRKKSCRQGVVFVALALLRPLDCLSRPSNLQEADAIGIPIAEEGVEAQRSQVTQTPQPALLVTTLSSVGLKVGNPEQRHWGLVRNANSRAPPQISLVRAVLEG